MSNKRFIIIHREGIGIGNGIKIIVDSITGVNYLFCSDGDAGGMTVLLDKDGRPVITPIEN